MGLPELMQPSNADLGSLNLVSGLSSETGPPSWLWELTSQQPWASPVQRTDQSSNHPLSHDLKDIYKMTFALLFSPTLVSLVNSHPLHSSSTCPLLVLVVGPDLCPALGHHTEVAPSRPGSLEQFPLHLQVSAKKTPLFSNFLDALWMPFVYFHCCTCYLVS